MLELYVLSTLLLLKAFTHITGINGYNCNCTTNTYTSLVDSETDSQNIHFQVVWEKQATQYYNFTKNGLLRP